MDNLIVISSIKDNIGSVSIGNEFKNKRALFRDTLHIDYDNNAEKTIEKIVFNFIKWESIYKNGKKTYGIKITDIDPNAIVIDNRTNNGGAHNNKYIDILKPIILSYTFEDFTFYNEIYRQALHFPKSIELKQRDSKYIKEYKKDVRDLLKRSINSALDSLQHDKLIKYEKVYVAKKYPFPAIHIKIDDLFTEPISSIFNHDEMSLIYNTIKELVDNNKIDKKNLSKFESIVSFKELVDFISHRKTLKQQIEKTFYNNSDNKYQLVPESHKTIIKDIENKAEKELSINSKTRATNFESNSKFTNYINTIYCLLGFYDVKQALHITILNSQDINADVKNNIVGLHKKYELAIQRDILKHKFNDYEIENNKIKLGKKKFYSERYLQSMKLLHRDEDFYYLAYDKGVNKLHCRLFSLPVNEEYFLQFLPNSN